MLLSPIRLRRTISRLLVLLALAQSHAAFAEGIPERPPGAPSGSEFARRLARMSFGQRDAAILAELASGNVPSFLRHPVPVTLRGANGQEIIVKVLPDYLAIGSDQDFVRVPMTPMTAQRVADAYGFMLPTQKIVDEIYKQAPVKLTPKPLPAGPQQTGVAYFVKHDQLIDRQHAAHGELVAGHKKDIVLTNRLVQRPGQVAIYGWHRPNGKAIQPLSLVHGSTYYDYSHGVRLVAATAIVDGQAMPLPSLLSDQRLASSASYEGRLYAMRQPRTGGSSPQVMTASHGATPRAKLAKAKPSSLRLAKLERKPGAKKSYAAAKTKSKALAKAKAKAKPKSATPAKAPSVVRLATKPKAKKSKRG